MKTNGELGLCIVYAQAFATKLYFLESVKFNVSVDSLSRGSNTELTRYLKA